MSLAVAKSDSSTEVTKSPHGMFLNWLRANPNSSGCAFFDGRIDSVAAISLMDGKRAYQYEVTCKPVDEWSGPTTFSFSHDSRVGQRGDFLAGVVRFRTWLDRPQTSKRPNADGELSTWRPLRLIVSLVEVF